MDQSEEQFERQAEQLQDQLVMDYIDTAPPAEAPTLKVESDPTISESSKPHNILEPTDSHPSNGKEPSQQASQSTAEITSFPAHPIEITLTIARHLPFKTLRILATASRGLRQALTPLLLRSWFDNFRPALTTTLCKCGGWRGAASPNFSINQCGAPQEECKSLKKWSFWLLWFLVVSGYSGTEEGMKRNVELAFGGGKREEMKGGLWVLELLWERLTLGYCFDGDTSFRENLEKHPDQKLGLAYRDLVYKESPEREKWRKRDMELIRAIVWIAMNPVDYWTEAFTEDLIDVVWDAGHVDMLKFLFEKGILDDVRLWGNEYVPKRPKTYGNRARNPFLLHRAIKNVIDRTETSDSRVEEYWEFLDILLEKKPEVVNWRFQHESHRGHPYSEMWPRFDAAAYTFQHAVQTRSARQTKPQSDTHIATMKRLLEKLHAKGAEFRLSLIQCFTCSYPYKMVQSRLDVHMKHWIPLMFEYGAKPDDIIPVEGEVPLKWTPLHPITPLNTAHKSSLDVMNMFLDAGYSGIDVPSQLGAHLNLNTPLTFIVTSLLGGNSQDKPLFFNALETLLQKRPACVDLPEWEECIAKVWDGIKKQQDSDEAREVEEDCTRAINGGLDRDRFDYKTILKVMEDAKANVRNEQPHRKGFP